MVEDERRTAADIPSAKAAGTEDSSDRKPTSSSLQLVDVVGPTLILPSGEAGPGETGDESFAPALAQTADFETRYAFRRLIGRGGMGEVNLVRDNTIGRDVAIKKIRGEGPRGRARAEARFLREARVQGQLEHPAFVPVYDLGVDPDGDLYFTMKRIRGKSLHEIFKGLRKKKPEILEQYTRRKLLTSLNRICQALSFAHTRGVLHRDLKPANIMIGDFGQVHVLDWGLAKLRHVEDLPEAEAVDSGEASIEHTVDGDVVGSVGFMAPEQLSGGEVELDERADVYALGALLFQMITHTPLHSGEVLEQIGSTLVTASTASERAPERDIPPELDAICARALAVDRDERFSSAAELSEALEGFLAGDRDLELRREAAEKHAQAAIDAMANSDDEATQRAEALREVSSALVLQPDNEAALRMFYRLLTEPPEQVPAEAQEALHRDRLAAKRTGMKVAASVYFSLMLLLPFAIYLGVKSWVAFGAQAAALAAPFVLSLWHLKRARHVFIPLDHLIAATVCVVVSIVVAGPFMLVPTVALANTAAYAAAANVSSRRVWVVVMGVLALIVPALMHLAGWVPSTFEIIDGEIVIQSLLFDLRPTWTEYILLAIYVPVIVGSGWYVGRVKAAHDRLETRMRVQAWQLSQIVPETLRHAAT